MPDLNPEMEIYLKILIEIGATMMDELNPQACHRKNDYVQINAKTFLATSLNIYYDNAIETLTFKKLTEALIDQLCIHDSEKYYEMTKKVKNDYPGMSPDNIITKIEEEMRSYITISVNEKIQKKRGLKVFASQERPKTDTQPQNESEESTKSEKPPAKFTHALTRKMSDLKKRFDKSAKKHREKHKKS